MDVEFRSPLTELFRKGEVDRDIRLLAARGVLAPRAHEQLALLALLVGDDDGEVAAAAEETIERIPRASIAAFLARPDVGAGLRDFFAARGVAPAPSPDAGGDAPLVEADALERSAADQPMGMPQRLATLSVAERVKVAMLGSREERVVLVRDPNRLVAAAVLSSPKLSDTEVEAFSRMTNVSEDVLRTIGGSRTWLKNYAVVSGLVRNPKTPVTVSLALLPRIAVRDLKVLSMDRNVPEAVRLGARKCLVNTQTRRA